MIANTLIEGETELGVHGVVVPMSDTVVSDTWRDASSMRGTGSNAVRVVDLFVPDERVVAPICRSSSTGRCIAPPTSSCCGRRASCWSSVRCVVRSTARSNWRRTSAAAGRRCG